jgi:hypothetical protein
MAEARSTDVLRTEIAVERAELIRAIDHLRAELSKTRSRARSKLKLVAGALAVGVVAFAGVRRLVRYGSRRLRS